MIPARDNGKIVDAPPGAETLARLLEHQEKVVDEAKAERAITQGKLCAMLGANAAMIGEWGEFSNKTQGGRISWAQLVARAKADHLKSEFRGPPYRVPILRMEGSD